MTIKTWVMVCLVALEIGLSGCSLYPERLPAPWKRSVSMNEPVDAVPPILIDELDGKRMLVMQAPNSGWSITLDKDERIATGIRVFITVRRPDPAFMYPQAIVDKRVLTEIHADTEIELYARVLGFDENTKGHGYGLLVPVERFEE
jgi:hypothetical protein